NEGGGTFYNLEGFELDIPDFRNYKIFSGDNRKFPLNCDSIEYNYVNGAKVWGGASPRNQCLNGKVYHCGDLYGQAAYGNVLPASPSRLSKLVPFKPVSHVTRYYAQLDRPHDITGININFFDTRPFLGRPSGWQSIFQEACGLNLGSYKGNVSNGWMGHWGDVEVTGGQPDEHFGTLGFNSDGSLEIADYYRNPDSTFDTLQNKRPITAVSGVWIRYAGQPRLKNDRSIPKFVAANWDSPVARTAIGFATEAIPAIDRYKMRIVVIQSGKAGAGVTVEDLRRFFPSGSFDFVMLLDGGGSSQLASTMMWKPLQNSYTTPGRELCLPQDTPTIKTCSLMGNTVPKSVVAHWDQSYKEPDIKNPNNVLIDRRVPQSLMIESRN
ncbi:MAG: phosphodiester glycosidase family protein, partial [Xanthomonadaceae bacterium]|nr:phosphodiester glycosidase family protein [Xanthomonadaceae bacterium]